MKVPHEPSLHKQCSGTAPFPPGDGSFSTNDTKTFVHTATPRARGIQLTSTSHSLLGAHQYSPPETQFHYLLVVLGNELRSVEIVTYRTSGFHHPTKQDSLLASTKLELTWLAVLCQLSEVYITIEVKYAYRKFPKILTSLLVLVKCRCRFDHIHRAP